MKKVLLVALIVVCMLQEQSALALSADSFVGCVVPAYEFTLLSPQEGVVSRFPWQTGQRVEAGQQVAQFELARYYAPQDGVVDYVWGKPGDDADLITGRYGMVVVLAPQIRYTVRASIAKAYRTVPTRYLHVGDLVTVQSVNLTKYVAEGRICSIESTEYLVEIIAGDLLVDDTVNLYNDPACKSADMIGQGTVQRAPANGTIGSGIIEKVHVKKGDAVKKGDLLFETSLDYSPSPFLFPEAGYVLGVKTAQGERVSYQQALITCCPSSIADVLIQVPENCVAAFAPDMTVYVQIENAAFFAEGKVIFVSYVSTPDAEEITYAVRVRFSPSASVRMGMSAEILLINESLNK